MGGTHSQLHSEYVALLQKERDESKAARETIERWRVHVDICMRDAEEHRQKMQAALADSQRQVKEAQKQVSESRILLDHALALYSQVPKPMPELLNINSHLIKRDEIDSVKFERYLYYGPRARVHVALKDGNIKQVMDSREEEGTKLVQQIQKMLSTPRQPTLNLGAVPVHKNVAAPGPPGGAVPPPAYASADCQV